MSVSTASLKQLSTSLILCPDISLLANMLNENYSYLGFIPVKMGPSGKILSIDLIFKK